MSATHSLLDLLTAWFGEPCQEPNRRWPFWSRRRTNDRHYYDLHFLPPIFCGPNATLRVELSRAVAGALGTGSKHKASLRKPHLVLHCTDEQSDSCWNCIAESAVDQHSDASTALVTTYGALMREAERALEQRTEHVHRAPDSIVQAMGARTAQCIRNAVASAFPGTSNTIPITFSISAPYVVPNDAQRKCRLDAQISIYVPDLSIDASSLSSSSPADPTNGIHLSPRLPDELEQMLCMTE